MNGHIPKYTFFLSVVLFLANDGLYSDTRFVTLSTFKSRSAGMGGAFTSMTDDLAALDFNPGAFTLSAVSHTTGFNLFLNPMGVATVISNYQRTWHIDVPVGLILRGASFSFGRFSLGLILGEEALFDTTRTNRATCINTSDYDVQRNTTVGFSVTLAPRVSLGIAADFLIRKNHSKIFRNMGYRYGIILKPKPNLSVGLCFVDFPNQYKSDRLPVERLGDETLNIGLSYKPWRFVDLALDVRNVSDDQNGAVREPHLGIEVVPYRHVVLRSGYYYDVDTHKDVISFGIGLFNWNIILPENKQFIHHTFSVNAAYVIEKSNIEHNHWLFLSTIIRI